MSRIIIPGGQASEDLAVLINRAIKSKRGKSHAFLCAVINDDGTFSIVTNMDSNTQRIELAQETVMGLKGN